MIQDVKIKSLKQVFNDRGNLLEIQRCDEEIYPGFGQIYLTTTFSGIIKAWYRHQHQIDQLIPIQGVMKLVLFDENSASPTEQLHEFIIDAMKPQIIQIPPYIWHGFQAIDSKNLILMHLNNRPQQLDCLDEERINFNDKRIPYQW